MPVRNDFCDKEELENLYWVEGFTQREIAKKFDVSYSVIRTRMKEFDIPTRDSHPRKTEISKEELEDLYHSQGLTQKEIGTKLGVSDTTISNHMKDHSVSIRDYGRILTKKVLEKLYLEERMDSTEIAKKLGIKYSSTILKYMEKLGIPRRCGNEVLGMRYEKKGWGIRHKSDGYVKIKRPNHPRASKYGFVSEHTVVWEEYHKKELPKGWIIHHINGIRDDNRIENLEAMPRENHDSWTLVHIYQERIRDLEEQIKLLSKKESLSYVV